MTKHSRSNKGDLVDHDATNILNAHAALAIELFTRRLELHGLELLHLLGTLASNPQAQQCEKGRPAKGCCCLAVF